MLDGLVFYLGDRKRIKEEHCLFSKNRMTFLGNVLWYFE